jgi:dephospho-CoA kinase
MFVIIGLTGGIASGKSSVGKMIKELGFPLVDADVAARRVVEKGEPAYEKIVDKFGSEILNSDETIDRSRLGSIVFQDEQKRLELNSIVHPAVRIEMQNETEAYIKQGSETVCIDIPLLFESNLTHMVDKTLLIYVSPHIQLKRLKERNGYNDEEAKVRIQSQMPLEKKIELADAVIDNNETLERTKKQLMETFEKWALI